MTTMPRFRFTDLVVLLAVVAAAAGTRVWYVSTCTADGQEAPPLLAQDAPAPVTLADSAAEGGKRSTRELDNLVANVREDRWFGGLAPLADTEEKTAHVAPAYPWLLALAGNRIDDPSAAVRWTQCGLGALTAGFYFLFARRAFRSLLVGTLAGLLGAVHPFWIVNTAELNDGVLATFLLAACLVLGTRGSEQGEAFTSLLYGLSLAGLSLVRAALLPFAVVALLWFLWYCRGLKRGWLCALLALLGFTNGVAPWTVRNFQTFKDVVPIADSTYLHLWIGNNSKATGGPQDEKTLREALPPERLKELLAEESQSKRYNMLGRDVVEQVAADPAGALRRRLTATLYFFFGQAWFTDETPGRVSAAASNLPEWLDQNYMLCVQATLLVLLVFGLLGWRWTYPWRRPAALATLAALWVPLPYVLSHAENLWGPRLPLDGVLLSFTAFALVSLLPGAGSRLANGPEA